METKIYVYFKGKIIAIFDTEIEWVAQQYVSVHYYELGLEYDDVCDCEYQKVSIINEIPEAYLPEE